MNCRGEADIRGSVFQHGCLAPDVNQQYVIVRVRFFGTLKLYRYWAPLRWQLTPGAIVRVWVSEREKYKNVTVCGVSSTARVTSVRALKAIDSIVSLGKPTNAETKDEVAQAGTAAVTCDEVISFKTLDYTDLELRAVAAMQQDVYKQFANHFMLDTSKQAGERVVGMPPELGMGYRIEPGTGKSSGITGKCITHMIIDDPLMEEPQAAPRLHRYNDRITIPHYPLRFASCGGGPLPSNIPKPKSQEDTVELKIQTITFVNGIDISKMTPDMLFSHINAAENEIRKLNMLVNKPKAVDDRIAALEKGIEALVRAADGDESATYKPVVEPMFHERLADSLPKTE